MPKTPPQTEQEPDQPAAPFLKFSATNQVHIDVGNLAEILRRYEADRAGFFGRIPRLR